RPRFLPEQRIFSAQRRRARFTGTFIRLCHNVMHICSRILFRGAGICKERGETCNHCTFGFLESEGASTACRAGGPPSPRRMGPDADGLLRKPPYRTAALVRFPNKCAGED